MSAEYADSSLFDLFKAEVEARGVELNDGILALEQGAGARQIEPLMRAAHSVKGAARIVGLNAAVALAHALEDTFVVVQEKPSALGELSAEACELWLRSTDELVQLGQQEESGAEEWLKEREAVWGELEGELQKLKGRLQGVVEVAGATGGQSVALGGKFEIEMPEVPEDPAALSMLGLFRYELATHVAAMFEALATLERGAESPSSLRAMVQAANSIKGAAQLVELPQVAELCDALERCFERGLQHPENVGPKSLVTLEPVLAWLRAATQVPEAEWTGLVQRDGAALQSWRGLVDAVKFEAVAAAPVAETAGAAVRISAAMLGELLALSAETQVEVHRMEELSAGWVHFRAQMLALCDEMDAARRTLATEGGGAGETLELVRQHLDDLAEEFFARQLDFEARRRRQAALGTQLHRKVLSSRMRPFSDGTRGMARLVRDVAHQVGKKARLEIRGGGTPVDRDVLERLEAPLGHLIRNAVDHGLELPEEREAGGKKRDGALVLEARHEAGQLVVSLEDDGRGIDCERVRRKVIERGLAAAEIAEKLSEKEVIDFLFLPGFSTAGAVTELSGRGVGLDVVQTMVQEAGGTLLVTTRAGLGTRFQLRLPVSRSLTKALLFEVNGEPYALPLSRVERVEKLQETTEVRELVAARSLLGLRQGKGAKKSGAERDGFVVMLRERTQQLGLTVEALLGEQQLVVRPLDERFGRVPGVSAASVLNDGTPVLILDADDLLHAAKVMRRRASGAQRRVLFAEDSPTVREAGRGVLEGGGWEVMTAEDGLEAWNVLQLEEVDLVVTDVDMPRMNGLELARKIRSEARLRTLPVVMVSYKDREEDVRRGTEAGADRYFSKGAFQDGSVVTALDELVPVVVTAAEGEV